jgi:hypothetical protein
MPQALTGGLRAARPRSCYNTTAPVKLLRIAFIGISPPYLTLLFVHSLTRTLTWLAKLESVESNELELAVALVFFVKSLPTENREQI